MRSPELGRRDNWKIVGQRQQVLVASDKIVGSRRAFCSQQRAQHRLVVDVTQGRFVIRQWVDQIGLDGKNVNKIVDLRGSQAMSAGKPGKNPPQFIEDETLQNDLDRAMAPSGHDLAWNAGRVGNAGKQDVRVEHDA